MQGTTGLCLIHHVSYRRMPHTCRGGLSNKASASPAAHARPVTDTQPLCMHQWLLHKGCTTWNKMSEALRVQGPASPARRALCKDKHVASKRGGDAHLACGVTRVPCTYGKNFWLHLTRDIAYTLHGTRPLDADSPTT